MPGIIDHKLNGTTNTGSDIDDALNALIDELLTNLDVDAGVMTLSNTISFDTSSVVSFETFPTTPSEAPDADYEVSNKKYVDNHHIPSSKIYDSGWFAITTSNIYSKTHSLGTTKCIVTLQVAQNSDGSGYFASFNNGGWITNDWGDNTAGVTINGLTTTTVSIATGNYYCFVGADSSRNRRVLTSAYARIIILALE